MKASLIFEGKARASKSFVGLKRSSLLCLDVGDEEKKFYDIDPGLMLQNFMRP